MKKKDLKGSQVDDHRLMAEALKEFNDKAREKFEAGILEHNPKGEKGLLQMSMLDQVKASKEELIDQWFYLFSLETCLRLLKKFLLTKN